LLTGAFLVVAAIVAPPTSAHHSFGAEYDVNQPITLTGVVTKVEWTNPHTHIYLDVKDDGGKVVNWQLEGYPPTALHRMGWRRDMTMKVGDTITVSGWRARGRISNGKRNQHAAASGHDGSAGFFHSEGFVIGVQLAGG
jgi:hypothetical protein